MTDQEVISFLLNALVATTRVIDYAAEVYESGGARGAAYEADETLRRSLERLSKTVEDVDGAGDLNDPALVWPMTDRLLEESGALLRHLVTTGETPDADTMQRLQGIGLQIADLAKNASRVRNFRAVERVAQEAAEASQDSARASAEAAGQSATTGLWTHFEALRTKERRVGFWLRIPTIALLLSALLFTVWVVFKVEHDSDASVWQHLSVSGGAFVLAGYLARLSAGHYEVSRWAAALSVQLLTIDAYTKPLEPDQRSALLMFFGERVFGATSDATSGDSAPELAGIVRDLSEAVRALQR